MEGNREEKIRQWKLLIKERLSSGLSVSKFCAAKGFTENTYYYWSSTIRKEEPDFDTRRPTGAPASPAYAFVEIKKPDMPSPAEEETQAFAGQPEQIPMASIQTGPVKIELFSNASAQFMNQLLEAVRHV